MTFTQHCPVRKVTRPAAVFMDLAHCRQRKAFSETFCPTNDLEQQAWETKGLPSTPRSGATRAHTGCGEPCSSPQAWLWSQLYNGCLQDCREKQGHRHTHTLAHTEQGPAQGMGCSAVGVLPHLGERDQKEHTLCPQTSPGACQSQTVQKRFTNPENAAQPPGVSSSEAEI